MIQDDTLVGGLALLIAALTTSIAIGPWMAPYQIRSIAAIQKRYGSIAARGVWLLIAFLSAVSGAAILSGIRPSYASPPATLNQNQ
ncbi:putative signal peptide and transmembrane protein [Rhodopirellula islandica]|uniref:Signal peptide and transmembrane protein n=1 Tax=Rhodopirellula islandica TaxID=595434 RepID=A0A0J1B8J3_RHOIS|nr:hypothetical protein [Rhodopirellula islandica]KLU02766.1 putative signal peptide and transmembrane protein [Rhodopirellula islandica]